MKSIFAIAVVFAFLSFGAIASSPAKAGTVSADHCGLTVTCDQSVEHSILPCRARHQRRIVGYRMVRRPIYRVVTTSPHPCCIAPQPIPVVAHVDAPAVSTPVQCNGDCAVDLRASYIGCVIRDGRQLWQYKTERGVYNMTMQRLNEADMIRLKDGKVAWVKA